LNLDLTQDHLADIVGARRESVSLLEMGRYNFSLFLESRISVAPGSRINEGIFLDDHF
jgi:DNA-binding XRE family transcriptional regulator